MICVTTVQIYTMPLVPGDTGSAIIILNECLKIQGIRFVKEETMIRIIMPEIIAERSCKHCNAHNSIAAHFCNGCGRKLPSYPLPGSSLVKPVFESLNPECRQAITDAIAKAYRAATENDDDTPLKSTSFYNLVWVNDGNDTHQERANPPTENDGFGTGILEEP